MNVLDIAHRDPRWSARRSATGQWSIDRVTRTGTAWLRFVIDDENPAGLHQWAIYDYRDGRLLATGIDRPAAALNALTSFDEAVSA